MIREPEGDKLMKMRYPMEHATSTVVLESVVAALGLKYSVQDFPVTAPNLCRTHSSLTPVSRCVP